MRLVTILFLLTYIVPSYNACADQTWPAVDSKPIFTFQTMLHKTITYDEKGNQLSDHPLLPVGLARIDHHGRLLTDKGAWIATNLGRLISKRCNATQSFALEVSIVPAQIRNDALLHILELRDTTGNSAFLLAQEQSSLLLMLPTPDGSSSDPIRVGKVTPGTVHHVAVSFGRSVLTVDIDGVRAVKQDDLEWDLSTWSTQDPRLGGNPKEQNNWSGALEGLAFYDTTLSADTARVHAETYARVREARSSVSLYRTRATLLNKSDIPTVEDMAPYTEALAVYEYRLDEPSLIGKEGSSVYVAHWVVMDRVRLPFASTPTGRDFLLALELFSDNPQLHGSFISDTAVEDFSLPLYYDACGLSLGLNVGLTAETAASYRKPPHSSTTHTEIQSHGPLHSIALPDLTGRLASLNQEVQSYGGWDQWESDLIPFRQSVRSLVTSQDTEYWGYEGADGFLFKKGSIYYSISGPWKMDEPGNGVCTPYAVLVDLHKQLLERDICMVFVPVPNKAEIYPDKIGARDLPPKPVYIATKHLISKLLEAGVDTVDLYPAYEQCKAIRTLFSKTDTHWETDAICLAASAVAERLSPLRIAPQKNPYSVRPAKLKRQGDILGANGIPEANAAKHDVEELELAVVVDSHGNPCRPVPDSSVVLVGDSFCGRYSPSGAGLGAHIAKDLGFPVTEVVSSGGGRPVARNMARQGSTFLQQRKAVVIVIGSRYLSPADDWNTARLP